jgi:hypothetical protein
MRIDYRNGAPSDPEILNLRAWDYRTGKKIDSCFMADDETGEYGQYLTDDKGKILTTPELDPQTFFGTTRIKLLPEGEPLYFL